MRRTALVTGASRRRGIGHAIVRRLLRDDGARVVAHTWAPYDAGEPWGADDPYAVPEDRLTVIEADLADLDPDTLDLTWRVNVRAALLLVQAFAEQYEPGSAGGRIVLFTSGQHRGPMPDEIPYVATEAAGVVALLLDPAAATITGQVVDAEGGFRRFTP